MVLYENYNSSYYISPHFEAHESYVTKVVIDSCHKIADLPYLERCQFIRKIDECVDGVRFVNYVELMFCTLNPTSALATGIASFFFLFLAILHFYILSKISDIFFCPTLSMVSKMLRLNEVLAGTTLLAFGNGSVDLLTSITQIDKESDLTYSELTGACVFVSTVVTSSIIMAKPFQIQASNIARDICFLIITMLYIDFMVIYGINIWNSIGLFVVYTIYVGIVFIDAFLEGRQGKSKKNEDFDIIKSSDFTDESTLCQQFLNSFRYLKEMTPFDILISPVMLSVLIVVPEVNCDPGRGWSKLLNCLQIMLTPALLTARIISDSCDGGCLGYSLMKGAWTLTITLPLAGIVYNTTTTKTPPQYHSLFAILSLFASTYMIFVVADELLNILEVLGTITGLSQGYLACTFLAYGFSVGDLVANTTFALRGNSEMALAACFAGPLFNVLVSLGVVNTYRCMTSKIGDPPPKLLQGDQGVNCTFFVIMIQSLFLLGLTFTNFYARRSLALFMILSYLVFLSFTTLSECEVIHAFGSYHLKS